MRITIEDLEALKELNDELEENHMETEKALQEEISELMSSLKGGHFFITYFADAKDIQIREQMRRADSLEDMCQDLENTISQFRELVLQLQGYVLLLLPWASGTNVFYSELEVMRTQTQNAQTESAHAASQTAAIMSLNMKLQSTAAKNQAKMIDLEIKKAEANETKELLGIIQVRRMNLLTSLNLSLSLVDIAVSSTNLHGNR
jgi:dynactin 1